MRNTVSCDAEKSPVQALPPGLLGEGEVTAQG